MSLQDLLKTMLDFILFPHCKKLPYNIYSKPSFNILIKGYESFNSKNGYSTLFRKKLLGEAIQLGTGFKLSIAFIISSDTSTN